MDKWVFCSWSTCSWAHLENSFTKISFCYVFCLLALQNFTWDSTVLLQLHPHQQACKPLLHSPDCCMRKTQKKPLQLSQLSLLWTGKSGNKHFCLSAGWICELIRKTNFHSARPGNFSKYNWLLNISAEQPGRLEILPKDLQGTGHVVSLWSPWATQILQLAERHSSLQQCNRWNARCFYRHIFTLGPRRP